MKIRCPVNGWHFTGHLVVVISHMRAVAQHVPALLRVTKTTAGSTVRWATEVELADLAD
ncbi:hypothetical protein [Allorhizocola rhizosphaerae]|uniref:hypothetical protein n=1 Tax=Allorhizocola rhizosphaerae TaxID=1872709 RepID=UPI0013C2E364|nr:hypothetical protein [Allorhizocola rhizosphaerae]